MSSNKMRAFSEILPTYKRFSEYTTPYRRWVWLDLITIVIAVLTNTAMIWLIGAPFNFLQQGNYDAVIYSLMLFAGVVVVNQLAQLSGGILTNRIGFYTIGELRNALLCRVLGLSFPVADKYSRGDVLARLSNDVDKIKACIVDAPLFLTSHIMTLILYVSMLFWIDMDLALLAMLITPVFFLHQRFFAQRKKHAAEKFFSKNGELLGFEEQAISNLRGIGVYGAESFVTKLHKGFFEKARFWISRERGLDIAFGVSFSFLIYLVGLVVVLIGVSGIKNNRFEVGHLISFLLYLGYLTVPARGLAEILFQCLGNLGAAKRVIEMFDAAPLVTEKENVPALKVTKGDIVISNLTFSYPDREPVYKNIDIAINGGETIAFVGPSGVGKSTLTLLLTRFYDPQSGEIRIDDRNIRDVTLSSLRNSITIVSQIPFLLNDTIRANLLMVKQEAEEADIIKACKASFAWEFIEKLEFGLDAKIGSGGVGLSTGQQQRVALAQAFLRDAPLLILDEATSALDSHGEQMIVDAIKRLRQNRTTLIIAHRYSSIKTANRVIYFNGDGSITVGNHQELMATHPGYQNAVQWQTSES